MPEIVEHGVTGLIGETDEELAELCRSIHRIDRRICRGGGRTPFSPAEMARGYEAIYRAETGLPLGVEGAVLDTA